MTRTPRTKAGVGCFAVCVCYFCVLFFCIVFVHIGFRHFVRRAGACSRRRIAQSESDTRVGMNAVRPYEAVRNHWLCANWQGCSGGRGNPPLRVGAPSLGCADFDGRAMHAPTGLCTAVGDM